MSDGDQLRKASEMLERAPAAPWVRDMHEYYRRTGTYRDGDIRRVVGDSTEGVKMATDASEARRELCRHFGPEKPGRSADVER
jgi:hypothetical protein